MAGNFYYSVIAPACNTLNAAVTLAGPNYFWPQRIVNACETLAIPAEIGILVEQFENYHRAKAPELKHRNWCLVVATGVGIAILAGVIAFVGLTRFRAPQGNLTDLLVKGLSAEAAKQVQVSWQMPLIDRILLFPKLCRLGINLGILTFSKDKKPALLNCGLQAFTLFHMAGIPRVKMEVVLPIEGVRDIKEVHAEIYAVIPSSKECSTLDTHLENSLKGIYEYAQNLFKESQWKLYEVTLTQGGVPMSTGYQYDIVVKEPVRTVCDCNQNFYLDHIGGWTFNRFYKIVAGINVVT